MDFGIAKSLQTESSLTQTGITLGTSAYLAPEQIRGEPLDRRTDIFASGRPRLRAAHVPQAVPRRAPLDGALQDPERVARAYPVGQVRRCRRRCRGDRDAGDREEHRRPLPVHGGPASGPASRSTASSPEASARFSTVTPGAGTGVHAIPSIPTRRSRPRARDFRPRTHITPPSGAAGARSRRTTTRRLSDGDAASGDARQGSSSSTSATPRSAPESARAAGAGAAASRAGSGTGAWIAAVLAAAASRRGPSSFLMRSHPSAAPGAAPRPAPHSGRSPPRSFSRSPGRARLASTQPGRAGRSDRRAGAAPPAPGTPRRRRKKIVLQGRPGVSQIPARFKVQFSSIPVATLSVDGSESVRRFRRRPSSSPREAHGAVRQRGPSAL